MRKMTLHLKVEWFPEISCYYFKVIINTLPLMSCISYISYILTTTASYGYRNPSLCSL